MNLRLLCILLLLTSAAAWSQGVTTGSISGSVFSKLQKDKPRTPLAGARVIALHEPTGTQYGAIVRANGRYTIKGMRVGGPYTVKASYVGYLTAEKKSITLQLGEETDVSFDLSEKDSRTEEVVVSAQRSNELDVSKTGSGSVISNEQITAAPTINRSISDFARINPLANQTQTAGSDGLQGLSIAGQNSRFNNFQIDGAVANDMFGLGEAGTAGSQANTNFISLDAIEELKVSVSPYDVRQSGFTGGVVNAITRGGTNMFKGSVFLYGRNEDLVGLSPDANKRPFAQFSDFQMGGRIGGPIIENTLFFHLTGEARLRRTPLELGLNDPNALNNFPAPKSQIDEIAEIAKTKYGYDAGNTDLFTSRNNSINVIGRLDWNINESNKLQLRHNYTYGLQDRNVRRDNTNFSLTSQWNIFNSVTNSSVAQLNTVFHDMNFLGLGTVDNVFNELRLSFTSIDDVRDLQGDPFPEVRVYLGGNQSVWLGPERSSATNALNQKQLALTDDFTLFSGDHTITLGTHNEMYFFNNLFIQDAFSSMVFPTAEAFANGTPSFYRISYANTNVTGGNTRPRAQWSMLQTGWYVSDEWAVHNDVKITAGIRLDVPIFFDTPYKNDTLSKRFPGFSTDQLPNNNLLFSPRIGFNYNVLGDKSLIVRGGTGLFTGRVAAVWLGNQYANTGMDIYRSELGRTGANQSLIIDPRTNQPFVFPLSRDYANDPLVPGDSTYPGQPIRTSVINLTDKNFRLPQTWRSTLGFDYKMDNGITFTVEGMYSQNRNEVDYTNMNLRPSKRFAVSPVDGRTMYASGSSSDSLRAKDFTQVLLLRNRNEGYQYSFVSQFVLDAQNKFIPGISAILSYTFGRAYDIQAGQNSVALSNWQNTDASDPNNVALARSNFDIPHRIMANISYSLSWTKDIKTTFGLVYSGNSGQPFGFTYFNDYNGDGVATNDLIYVPKREDYGTKIIVQQPSAGTDLRTPSQIFDQLMQFVEANPTLREYQGQILPRNAMRTPWVNLVDMRITQTIPTFSGQKIELTLDIQNVLNMFNSEWGLQKFVDFQSFGLIGLGTDAQTRTVFDRQNRLIITYNDPSSSNGGQGIYTTDNFYSRWRMQLGMRYTF